MVNYVFSEELYRPVYGRPRGRNIWFFGDRNQVTIVRAGAEDDPIFYSKAKKIAQQKLMEEGYPFYKTVYLLPLNCVK